jgi:hypothetical protein
MAQPFGDNGRPQPIPRLPDSTMPRRSRRRGRPRTPARAAAGRRRAARRRRRSVPMTINRRDLRRPPWQRDHNDAVTVGPTNLDSHREEAITCQDVSSWFTTSRNSMTGHRQRFGGHAPIRSSLSAQLADGGLGGVSARGPRWRDLAVLDQNPGKANRCRGKRLPNQHGGPTRAARQLSFDDVCHHSQRA